MTKVIMLSFSLLIAISNMACTTDKLFDENIPELPSDTDLPDDENIIETGIVTDVDGNEYVTIIVGDMEWMAENLRTTKYNDGTSISFADHFDNTLWQSLNSNKTGGYSVYYNNDDAINNQSTYGLLYNWYAIETGKLAPEGWRIPSDEDWTNLENWLIVNGYNYDNTLTGNKIAKSMADNTLWGESSNPGAIGNKTEYPTKDNASKFAALPGGRRLDDGSFSGLSRLGYWWSSTETGENNALYGYLFENDADLHHNNRITKNQGFSIRCVRDVE